MVDMESFSDALRGIGERVDEDMSEKDVENAFLNENFYELLGYDGAGFDLRSEWTLPDERRPDYVTLDTNESVTAVYEFKAPGRDLSEHTDQLFHYVDVLKSDYGVLTNGQELRLYKRDGHAHIATVSFIEVNHSNASDLAVALQKPEWDITDAGSVNEFLDALDAVSLEGELGQEHFFDTFRLEEGSPFADLVTGMMGLLQELRDEREAKFVKGAFDFWKASYANVPDDVPGSWGQFIDGNGDLHDFMFCLESGHALLGRLLLAKATEDHDFFRDRRGLERYFDELGGFSGKIDLDAYPIAANGMIEDMRTQLVESLFEDDIFIWWTDGYAEQTASQHKDQFSRFREVAEEGSDVTRVSPATRERFSRAVAHVSFAVLKFDFSQIEGDPLGDLYQRYFDPETRKALGEFYTPQPVVDYIMDGVAYETGVSRQRLIDPACGSGTFLVEAVDRYLEDVRRYDDDPNWTDELTELCSRPRIVGLDIHPFAVLMAQIRFMVAILPEYKQAKHQDEDFTIHRLPIFRTDTLRNERELTGIDLGDDSARQLTFDAVTEDNQDVLIPVPLPIEVNGDVPEAEQDGEFLVQRVRMPLFDNIRLSTEVRNFGEYFAALQGVLDVVKFHMSEDMWEYRGGLEQGIHRYTTREYDGIEDFFAPYVDDILNTVRYLQEEHGDGRLIKMFEDTVLALVVKNYMEYDYVVGNPPYVRIQHLPNPQKAMIDQLYESSTGNYDIYCPFYERGLALLKEGVGRLGYIAPNQFMVTEYGEGLRRVLLRETKLNEVYDFRDSGVFKDATNYPAIVIAADEPDADSRKKNQIRCVRVKASVDNSSRKELDEAIVKTVREHRTKSGYTDEFIDVFDFPQSKLGDGYWSLMPPEELAVFEKVETQAEERIKGITDSVSHGTQTSANSIYVVNVVDSDRICAQDAGDTVRIVPSGESKEYEIETDLLRPWLQGNDVQRWRSEWSGQHVILPYDIREIKEGELSASLYSEETMKNKFPLTWAYFLDHEDDLKGREGNRWKKSDTWWEFGRPQNLEKFEVPKIIFAHIATQATYMLDEIGTWYYKTAYSVRLNDEMSENTEELACQLNSKVLDFYFKHITTVKMGGFYEYRSQYVEKLPCIINDSNGAFELFQKNARNIVDTIDLKAKTNRFPEAYLGEYDGELDYIDYIWQTRRHPVNADIEKLEDGRFTVTAGRSDEITDPLIDRGDHEEKKLRARYVHTAVDGRNVKRGEETSIPIPAHRDGIETLLDALEQDRKVVEETSIEELEAEIDEAVYDLFELTEEEQQVIEDYLEVF